MVARLSLILRFGMIDPNRPQTGQGMVEYALILALVALIVIVALIATGGQLINLFSNITKTMCLYKVGC
jgi:pilus assembly protein Flp/PilA